MSPRPDQDRPPFRLLVITDRHRVPGDLYTRVALALGHCFRPLEEGTAVVSEIPREYATSGVVRNGCSSESRLSSPLDAREPTSDRGVLDERPTGVAVLLREHDLPLRSRLDLARRLIALCRPAGVPFLVADRLDLALACGADGVHLGTRSLPVADVRQAAPQLLVGCSCHCAEELNRAAHAGAHYATLSPVFPTNSKPDATPLGPREAVRLAAEAALPVFALGGVDASRLAALQGSAFTGVAVVEGVLAAPAPSVAARTLSDRSAQTLPNAVSELLGNSETP